VIFLGVSVTPEKGAHFWKKQMFPKCTVF